MVSLHHFLVIAAMLPSLESIDFKIAVSSLAIADPSFPRDLPSVVGLPNLRSLALALNSYHFAIELLSRLELPSVTSVKICVDVLLPTLNTLLGFLPSNPSMVLPAMTDPTAVEVWVQSDRYSTGVRVRSGACSVELELSVPLVTRFDWCTAVERRLVDIMHIFLTAPITTLTIQGLHDPVSLSTWRDFFTCFPGLETIEVHGHDSLRTLWTALGAPLSTPASTARSDTRAPLAQQTVTCPSLKSVAMEGTYTIPSVSSTLFAVQNALWYRIGRGHRLGRLSLCFDRSYVPKPGDDEYWKQLGELVTRLEVVPSNS